MNVQAVANKLSLKVISMPEPEREITGGYTGDLLSWVMGRAKSGDAWITIMSNINIVAVASLADTACIILTEGVELDDAVSSLAKEKGVNILSYDGDSFTLSYKLSNLIV